MNDEHESNRESNVVDGKFVGTYAHGDGDHLLSRDFIRARCPRCKYYDLGICRRMPPQGSGFPKVDMHDWCPRFWPTHDEIESARKILSEAKAHAIKLFGDYFKNSGVE